MNVRAPFEPADAVALLQLDGARLVAIRERVVHELALNDVQVDALRRLRRGTFLTVHNIRRHLADGHAAHLAPRRPELVNNDLPELEHHERRRARSAHPPRPGADASTPRTPHGPPRRAAHLTALVGVIAKGEKPPP